MKYPHRNVYYYDPKVIDLSKLREEAQDYATRGGWSKGPKMGTTIHYHRASDECTMYKHEEIEVNNVSDVHPAGS